MRMQALWLVLAFSLLFNVFFAVGYVRARVAAAEGPRDMASRVQAELGLDDDQAARFRSLQARMREDTRVLWEGAALVEQQILEELGRDEPDPLRLRELGARKAELHRQRRTTASALFGEFMTTLSPDQRGRFSKRMRHDRHRGHDSERALRHFDANGDGRLDEAERAEADRAIEEHRRSREERWREERDRFDADGDGQLDETERAALRDWMRENGRERYRREHGR